MDIGWERGRSRRRGIAGVTGGAVPQGTILHERDELPCRVGPVAAIGRRRNRPLGDDHRLHLDPRDRIAGLQISEPSSGNEKSRRPGISRVTRGEPMEDGE